LLAAQAFPILFTGSQYFAGCTNISYKGYLAESPHFCRQYMVCQPGGAGGVLRLARQPGIRDPGLPRHAHVPR